jgi:glycerol-3-phosphate dehydrogenase (NAD(P)+)
MTKPVRVTVLGGGSWGTTVASLTAGRVPTLLWTRDPETATEINAGHRNSRYLGDYPLDPALRATDAFEEAVADADVLVLGVPTQTVRGVLERARGHLRPWTPVVSLSKGLEIGTGKRMTEVIQDVMPGHPAGTLAGPNLAKEILQGYAAAAVVAMRDEWVARSLQGVFASRNFRVYTNTDVVGTELGGAFKNVIAIAAGMAEGLSVGDNTRATVITRGLAEITRLGRAMGGEAATFAGLAGMGDLMATCISPLSRNRRLGAALAQGKTMEQALAELGQVAEGVHTARVMVELAEERDVSVPVAREVRAVLHEGRTVEEAYRGLARQKPAAETAGGAW